MKMGVKMLFAGVICLLFGVSFEAAAAQGTTSPSKPHELFLIFSDRILNLNFVAQPDLLEKRARHFLVMAGQRIPVEAQGELLEQNEFLELETDFEWRISKENLKRFFDESDLARPKNSVVEIRFEENKEEDADILFEGKPYDGFRIEYAKLYDLIDAAIIEGEKFVRVPAKKTFSNVIVHPDLEKRGISEIIAIGKSNFSGSSAARRQNILAGAQKFNGQIIKKGNRFSFNKILENVDEESGFVRELVIKGNKTKKELGGGVCQVSTTAFRAAFNGGLPIVARRNHSYAVPYYKPFGLDAAIYLGALDLRFRNDTPGDILIQTFIEGDDLFFVFYGTNDGRKVSIEGPFISDYKLAPEALVFESEDLPPGEVTEISGAHDGFRSEWVRKISKGEEVQISNFESVYRPWPARVLKGKSKKPSRKKVSVN